MSKSKKSLTNNFADLPFEVKIKNTNDISSRNHSNDDNIYVSFDYRLKSQEYLLTFSKGDNFLEVNSSTSAYQGFDDIVDYIFEESLDEADQIDYLLAATSGLLAGMLDIFWVGEFSIKRANDWGRKTIHEFVIKTAIFIGYKNDDLQGAVRFLERKFPLPADGAINDLGGGLQHHLRDFSHHPTVAGLFFSILTQFTENAYGTDTEGNFRIFPIKSPKGIGTDFVSKIYKGTVDWFFHLISDMAGSSSYPGEGTGIPGPILSQIKEISSLPIIKDMKIKYKNNPIGLSQWISKVFNGSLFSENSNLSKSRMRFDLRLELGFGHELFRQSVPVIFNECLVRALYSIRRLFWEIKKNNIISIKDVSKINPDNFLPKDNRILTRMITVASGTFLITDLSGASVNSIIKSKKSKMDFGKEFFLSINYVGIGRFILACKADYKYIGEDIQEAFKRYMKKHSNKTKDFSFEEPDLKDFILNERRTRIYYSLVLQMLRYDIEKTKTDKKIHKKQRWVEEWKNNILEMVDTQVFTEHFFIEEADLLYNYIQFEVADDPDSSWLYLIAMDLLKLKPYYQLDNEMVIDLKGLKFNNDYLKEEFCNRQTVITEESLNSIATSFKRFENILTNNASKKLMGVAATVAVSIATGGVAFAFAPQIAVFLVGGSFTGLSGAALTSASLAMLGGGSLAIGGFGMAGGTALVAGGGALLGSLGSGVISTALSTSSPELILRECTKLLTFSSVLVEEKPEIIESVQKSIAQQIENLTNEIESLKVLESQDEVVNKKDLMKELKVNLKYLQRCNDQLSKMLVK